MYYYMCMLHLISLLQKKFIGTVKSFRLSFDFTPRKRHPGNGVGQENVCHESLTFFLKETKDVCLTVVCEFMGKGEISQK